MITVWLVLYEFDGELEVDAFLDSDDATEYAARMREDEETTKVRMRKMEVPE